mgnify:CR=1 FL=1
MTFALVDYINYSCYKLELVNVYSEDNLEGDPNRLYYATVNKSEDIYYKIKVTKNNKPCHNHTLVAVGQQSGVIRIARQISDEQGEATFILAVNTVFQNIDSIEAIVQFYDESTAWIIEFRLEKYFVTTLYKRAE